MEPDGRETGEWNLGSHWDEALKTAIGATVVFVFGWVVNALQITARIEWLTRYLGARLDALERRLMASIDELNAALDRLTTEVSETAAEIKNLRDEIDALKLKTGDTATLEAAITAASARANDLANRLDALQPPPAPPAQ